MKKLWFLLLLLLIPARGNAQQAVIGASCPASGQNAISNTGVPVVCTQPPGGGALVWTAVGGGSSGGGSATNSGQYDPVASNGVKPGVIYGFDATTSGGSNSISSTAQACSTADVGKVIAIWSPTFTSFQLANNPPTTVTGCSGNNWLTSVNATGGAGVANQTFMIGFDNGAALAAAYLAANTANKTLALPCGQGALLVATTPFPAFASQDFVNQVQDINGKPCGNVHFVLHPNITQAYLAAGGVFFANWSGTTKAGTLTGGGLGGQSSISDLFLTTLGMPMIGAAGKQMTAIGGFLGVSNIAWQSTALSAGTFIANSTSTGEGHFHKLNYQSFLTGGSTATYFGVVMTGQGQNLVDDSIFAFQPLNAIQCNGAICSSVNNYFATVTSMVTTAGSGNTISFINNTGSCLSGNGSVGCVTDNAGSAAIFYAFANTLNAGSANLPVFICNNAGTTLDLSGSQFTATTSGFSISGACNLNERRGNTFTGPLTQFTGFLGTVEQGICTNTTPVTVNANVATDQLLMSCTVPANFLYTPGVSLGIWLSGVYSTPAASTTAIVVKAKLGTLTLATWTSTALGGLQATNDQFNVEANFTVQTAGSSAAFEAHGNMVIDLGVGNTVADSTFADVNTATVSPVDLTVAETLQITIAFTAASASNSATQRQLKAQIW
jgi:hypothetical protein